MKPQVLQLDIQGTPQAWISLEQAASHYATGAVVWEDGVGPLATNEEDMENACNPDVVDKLSLAAQKRRVLDPIEAARLLPY